MKFVPKTTPQSDGSLIHDVYMVFKERRQLMTTWLCSFRHETDMNEWLAMQASK